MICVCRAARVANPNLAGLCCSRWCALARVLRALRCACCMWCVCHGSPAMSVPLALRVLRALWCARALCAPRVLRALRVLRVLCMLWVLCCCAVCAGHAR